MAKATLDAVADHADVPVDSIHGTYGAAQRVLTDLAAIGIDYDNVMQALEDDGVAKFDVSWDQLGEELARTLQAPKPAEPKRLPAGSNIVERRG